MIEAPHRLPVLAAIVAVAGLATVHYRWRNEPFDASLGEQITGGYTYESERAFSAHGIFAQGGRRTLVHHRDAVEIEFPYWNHPILPIFLVHPLHDLFGGRPEGLRAASFVHVVLLLAGFLVGVSRHGGRGTAALATALLATMPALVVDARICCPPLFGLPWMALALASFCAPKGVPGTRGKALYFGFGLWAALSDWNAYGVVPALWTWIAMQPGFSGRRFRSAMFVALPFGLGILLHVAWVVVTSLGFRDFWSYLREVNDILAAYDGGFPVWICRMRDYAFRVLGATGIAAVPGIIVLLVRRRSAVAGFAATWAVAGIVPCLVFWSRAGSHLFWVLVLAPAAALLAVAAVETAFARPAGRVAAVLVLALLNVGVMKLTDRPESTPRYAERGEAIQALVRAGRIDDRDVVLFPDYDTMFASRAYTTVCVVPQVATRELYDRAIELLRPGRDRVGNLWFALPVKIAHEHAFVATLPFAKPPETLRLGDVDTLLAPLNKDAVFGAR